MKPDKWKELVSLVLSFLLALALFLILLLFLHWNLILCMVPAAAAYIAFSLILRPVARIGKVEVESLANGEFLNERLTEAGSDYARMQKAVQQIREQPLLDECRNLMETASGILKYLTDNPEKIPAARRYIDYYQETAANVLEHYVELKKTGLSTRETEKVLRNTRESIATLKSAFDLQFEKLMQNELMDMEADLNLLKQTLKSEGYQEPAKESSEKKGQETQQ
ncbi:5-bromo-4-chloroindolyl phosphate hydrolysis family protein [Clostridium sp. Marseille-P3244]|uniref:5-bromo-4-chloroindolyl phosphate hydrolysis family protein n=1 Tax=Clostridium sp. Marseille-P3244 TaxID=1871020 RepID=UPI00093162DF|nr:5-bromo-4-chloroindolyl phosphate hydrolysis family protein [Clostridium sp. Marseille-P3244]